MGNFVNLQQAKGLYNKALQKQFFKARSLKAFNITYLPSYKDENNGMFVGLFNRQIEL